MNEMILEQQAVGAAAAAAARKGADQPPGLVYENGRKVYGCLLYTSPSPRDS